MYVENAWTDERAEIKNKKDLQELDYSNNSKSEILFSIN